MVWPAGIGAVHLAAPTALAQRGRRHGWRGGRPGPLNVAGLAAVAAGGALVVWPLRRHYRAAPGQSWALEATIAPEYLLTDGPYRFTRNPMYVGAIVVWSGWAVFYGTARVAVGAAAVATGVSRAVRWEERALERRFGDEWRSYAAATKRWL